MQIDFIARPDLAERYRVVDVEAAERIDDVAWADDEAGLYAVFRRRPRTLSDRQGADTRLRDARGAFLVDERNCDILIEDLAVNPLKSDMLALLDDPDVVAKLKRVMGDAER